MMTWKVLFKHGDRMIEEIIRAEDLSDLLKQCKEFEKDGREGYIYIKVTDTIFKLAVEWDIGEGKVV